jgi:mono/diheme cytochrome c family protein
MSWGAVNVRLRKILLGILAVLVLAVLGGIIWMYRPALPAMAAGEQHIADRQLIAHGAGLAAIGNCVDCHTTEGRPPFAGGRPIPTPFGTIYASNITPDRETGIGSWTEAAFRRAMHDGVDRDGRQLYPAFPYDHFTKATDADIHALYAFLMSGPAVRNQVAANELNFPFNFRPLVAGWKLLFFREARLDRDDSKSDEWNRGRYLVEGLGHCGACHSPRNALGAEKRNSAYAGGVADGWNAPPLDASLVAAHRWTVDQLAEYLSTGWHALHGAAAGPMADVAKNLGQASTEDVRAIAVYIASLSDGHSTITPRQNDPAAGASPEVVAIYNGACANCHNNVVTDAGDVGPSKALSLSLSTAVHQPGSANTVRAILGGIQSYSTGGPYMPAFDGMLTDQQIAAVAQYVRARYTDQPQWTDIQAQITQARQQGAQP